MNNSSKIVAKELVLRVNHKYLKDDIKTLTGQFAICKNQLKSQYNITINEINIRIENDYLKMTFQDLIDNYNMIY